MDGVELTMRNDINPSPLVDLLLKISSFSDSKTRSALLHGIPGRTSIRRSDISKIDMSLILQHALNWGTLDNGTLALDLFYKNVVKFVPPNTQLAVEIKEQFDLLRSSLFSQLIKNNDPKQSIERQKKQRKTKLSTTNQAKENPSLLNFIEIDKAPKTDSDRPSGPDRLNYNRYAEAFAKIILNHETSTPLTIGIYGQWGQGKSFLMGKIKEALKYDKSSYLFLSPLMKRTITFMFLRRNEIVKSLLERDFFEDFIIQLDNFFYAIVKVPENFFLSLENWRMLGSKSTEAFLNFQKWVSDRKKKRREEVDVHFVEFNAWAYVGTDHLWAGLVTQLYKEAEKYFGLRLHFARLGRAIKKSLPKSILIFAFYALLGAGLTLLLQFNETKSSWDALKITINAFAGSILAGSAIASLPNFLTALKDFADNLVLTRSKNLQNLAARPDFRAQIGLMAEIKEEISFIGKLLRKGKDGHPTRFILFIDDLDRCEHKKAVEVMQAIMLLLTDEDGAPFVVFMGIDARVIVHAIEETYGEVLVKAGINGYEYLDKIVQIPFVIPSAPLEDIKSYIDSMLWTEEEKNIIENKKLMESIGADNSLPAIEGQANITLENITMTAVPLEEISVSFTEVERTAINQCVEYVGDNPRKIKRIINIYRFTRLVISGTQDRAKVIRWLLMTEQWPLHIAWVIERIESDLQTKNQLKNKTLTDVYKLAKKNIRSKEMESLLTIDADPDNFESFLGKHDFTVQEILALIPLTFNLNPAIRSEVSKHFLKAEKANQKSRKTVTKKKPASSVQSA
jgi:ankyrin repeat-rich membrane spanning protein